MDQTGRDQESYENHASIFWTGLHCNPLAFSLALQTKL